MALASLVATNNTSARNSPQPFFEQFDVNQKNTSHKSGTNKKMFKATNRIT